MLLVYIYIYIFNFRKEKRKEKHFTPLISTGNRIKQVNQDQSLNISMATKLGSRDQYLHRALSS
jgi:hypothetical protein